MFESGRRAPECRGRRDLAGGPEGAKPTGKFSGSGKAERLFRCSGALWLATMRNLPNHQKPGTESEGVGFWRFVVLRFAREMMADAGMAGVNISSDRN